MSYVVFPCGCKFKTIDDLSDDILVDENTTTLPKIVVNFDTVNKDCTDTWNLLASGKTKGVFQLETPLGAHHCKQIAPKKIEEMSDIISLIRPGSLESFSGDPPKSQTKHYIDRKNGTEEIEYICPEIKQILSSTYGVLCYQEQSMEIAKRIAGFTLQEADDLRKSIGKKDTELMSKLEETFINGCKKIGIVSEKQSKDIFNTIRASQSYSFNLCVSGNTKLCKKNNGGPHKFHPTVKEMYSIRNDINYAKHTGHLDLYKKWKFYKSYRTALSMCDDSRVRPNTILDIRPMGVQKTYRVMLVDGEYLACTLNHKFPTSRGEKPLKKLKIGDEIYVVGQYEYSNGKTYGWSDITKNELWSKEQGGYHNCGFVKGERNPGYTNGEWTKYQKNIKKLEQKCYQCGKSKCRLETHHIDGDRLHNELDNLTNLCVSCHKKEHYNSGRCKKGQKGYPTVLKKIISIEYMGEEEVFDVEMQGPNHNFVTDTGIITSNSHSVSYAKLGYTTAYLKQHFPLQFFCSYLTGAKWKMHPNEEIKALAQDAKQFNIEVLPPTLTHKQLDFHILDNKIYFGVGNIKGIGGAAIDKIKDTIEDIRQKTTTEPADWTWLTFLILFSPQVSSSTVEPLISTGGLDFLNISRQKMLYEYNLFSRLTTKEIEWCKEQYLESTDWQTTKDVLEALAKPKKEGGGCSNKNRVAAIKTIIGSLDNPPHTLEDLPLWVSSQEEKMLGVALTRHKTDGRADASRATNTLKNIEEIGIVAAEIVRVKHVVTKKNQKDMAFLDLEDGSGRLEGVVCFNKEYENIEELIFEGNTVLAQLEKNQKKEGYILQGLWQI